MVVSPLCVKAHKGCADFLVADQMEDEGCMEVPTNTLQQMIWAVGGGRWSLFFPDVFRLLTGLWMRYFLQRREDAAARLDAPGRRRVFSMLNVPTSSPGAHASVVDVYRGLESEQRVLTGEQQINGATMTELLFLAGKVETRVPDPCREGA
jgi:hypothetical protein